MSRDVCMFLASIWLRAFKGETNDYYRVKVRCLTSTVDFAADRRIKEEDELWLTFHITSWYVGNNITTMVNCLETDLLKGPCSPNRLCVLVFCFETVPLLNAWCLLDVTFTSESDIQLGFLHIPSCHTETSAAFTHKLINAFMTFRLCKNQCSLHCFLGEHRYYCIWNCFLTLHMMTVIVWCFEFEKKLNATNCLIREDTSLILNCQNSIWPACARVGRWETLEVDEVAIIMR